MIMQTLVISMAPRKWVHIAEYRVRRFCYEKVPVCSQGESGGPGSRQVFFKRSPSSGDDFIIAQL